MIGRLRIKHLDKVRWDQFLAGMTARWSPRSKAIAQQHYVRILRYAKSVGAVEVVQADWSDVDRDRGVMRFAGFVGRRKKGKNKQATHWVPITPLTMPYLVKWWEDSGKPKTGPLFTWRGMRFSSWRHAWKRTVERSGIDPEGLRRITCYSARFTYATLGAVAGVAPAAMRTGMRHTSESRIMEKVYQRLHAEQVQSAFSSFPSCKAEVA